MGRDRKRIILMGQTGCGKSTAAEEMAMHRNKKYQEPVIVLDPNNQKKWWSYPSINFEQLERMESGTYRIVTMDYGRFFEIIYKGKKKFQVVSDDTSVWITPHKDMRVYPSLVGLRHGDNDLYFITHAVRRTPEYLIELANEVLLYKTGDTWEKCYDRIPERIRDEFKEAFDKVNADPDPHAWERIIITKTGTK